MIITLSLSVYEAVKLSNVSYMFDYINAKFQKLYNQSVLINDHILGGGGHSFKYGKRRYEYEYFKK